MFVIKQKQIEALTKIRIDAFKKRLESHLKEHFNQLINKLNKEQFEYFIDEGIKRAEKYCLQTEYHIMVYFNIMLTLGLDFEKNEDYGWVAIVLNNKALNPEEKIELLIDKIDIS